MKRIRIGCAALCAALLLTGCQQQSPSPSPSGPAQEPVAAAFGPVTELPPAQGWLSCPIVAHAMGQVDGRPETNSLDAFLASYQAGHRVFEVDLQMTSDGFLVARHDWDQTSYYNLEQTFADVMDHQTFLETPICFYYTPLDIDGILALMAQYPDMYIVTDSKDTDEQTVRTQFQAIAQAIDRAKDPTLWDRIVVQIYHEDMLAWVQEEGPVSNWIFTLYQIASPDYGEIGAFCQENGIAAVTMEQSRQDGEATKLLHSYGCRVYLHTVNRLRAMLELSWLADGFYSDCVTPAQLEGVLAGTNAMYLGQEEVH